MPAIIIAHEKQLNNYLLPFQDLAVGNIGIQEFIRTGYNIQDKKDTTDRTGCIHFKKYPYFWVCRKKKTIQTKI
ncbi:hypothetical protein SAMN05428949_6154 [Chitinophaga sp. YR627]|nr:hypothetical protein SAMN05428949_6154 [Chitinophaga sp. YR627]